MDSKLEEVQRELYEKENSYKEQIKNLKASEKQLKSDLNEANNDVEHFKDLYESSVKNIQDFKS